MIRLGVSGHRPQKMPGKFGSSRQWDTYLKTVRKAFDHIQKERGEIVELVCGMALGWDMACAAVADNRDIQITAYLPTTEAHNQRQGWDEDSKLAHILLLEKANIICSPKNGMGYAYNAMQRNKSIVDNSDVMLFLWGGIPYSKKNRSGTAACHQYAQRQGVKCWNAYKLWLNLWERDK